MDTSRTCSPCGHCERASAVINLTLGVARADTKCMPISTLPKISGRAAVRRPSVTWFRIVCRMSFRFRRFQPPSQALAFRRGCGERSPGDVGYETSAFPFCWDGLETWLPPLRLERGTYSSGPIEPTEAGTGPRRTGAGAAANRAADSLAIPNIREHTLLGPCLLPLQ